VTIHKTSKAEKAACLLCLGNNDIHLNAGTCVFKSSAWFRAGFGEVQSPVFQVNASPLVYGWHHQQQRIISLMKRKKKNG